MKIKKKSSLLNIERDIRKADEVLKTLTAMRITFLIRSKPCHLPYVPDCTTI